MPWSRLDIGHAQTVAFIERRIRELEGPRQPRRRESKRRAAGRS
jgi:hypothetical protein